MVDTTDLFRIDWQALTQALMHWGMRLAIGLVILLVGWWLARLLASGLQRVMTRGGADPLIVGFVRNLAFVLLFALVAVGALDRIGVPTASLLAALGAAGLAIGLALQGSLSNLAAGVLLMLFRPFRVGQYVEAAGIGGTVENVTLMHTHLITPDNRLVILPNAKVAGDAIVNFSTRGIRRIDLAVTLGYDSDLALARALVRELFTADVRILTEPAPEVAVQRLNENGIELAIRPWVKASDVWAVQTSLLASIQERFENENLRLAPAPRELVLHGPPSPSAAPAA